MVVNPSVRLKPSDPAKVLPGFDYDVTNEEVLLTRLGVKDSWLILPDGMRYRILVLPNLPNISLAAIQKVRELVRGGATVLGPRPERATGLDGAPDADGKVRPIAAEVWGDCDGEAIQQHRFGQGRIVCAGIGRELLVAYGAKPAFEAEGAESIDFIHRSAQAAEIYFVSNQSGQPRRFPAISRQGQIAGALGCGLRFDQDRCGVPVHRGWADAVRTRTAAVRFGLRVVP